MPKRTYQRVPNEIGDIDIDIAIWKDIEWKEKNGFWIGIVCNMILQVLEKLVVREREWYEGEFVERVYAAWPAAAHL